MPFRRATYALTLALLGTTLIAGLPAVAHADTPAPSRTSTTGTNTTEAANVTRATLANGLRVIIVRDRLAPVVTTELNYLTGSAEAPDGFPGTAHALEHMMFRGSAGLDRDQLSFIGAQLGGDYNADTTEDVTQYFYTAPAANLDVVLQIEALRMKGLLLKQEDWDKERGAIEQEVSRDLSSPAYRYISQLQGILYAGTPYAHDALGTRPSFDKTDAAILRGFYQAWYAPNNAVLVITGDVDPAATLAQVRAAFDAIPAHALPARQPVTPGPLTAQTLSLPTDYPVGLVTLAYRMPGMRDPDFAVADILSDVLASRRGALYQLVPQGKALFAGFEPVEKARAGVGIAVGAFPSGSDPTPLIGEMKATLAAIRAHGVPAELVEAAKRKEIAQIGFGANSIAGLAENWSQAVALMGLNSLDDLAAAYARVTPDAVNAMARRMLDPAQSVTAVLTPDRSGKAPSDKGFGGAESFAAAADHKVALPDWAERALARLDLPAESAAPDVSTLPNGLRLIVVPSHVSHTVVVTGQVRQDSDLQEPPGQEGVAALTNGLFSYGTTRHDRLAFQKALDDIAAQESAGDDFSLSVLSNHFDQGLALLAENELSPAFPDAAFTVVRQQQAQTQAGELTSPGYLFSRAITAALNPPHDPSLRQATPQTIMATRLADVKAYYHAAYRPDLTTIVVAGDITVGQARAAVARAFGGWTAQGPTPVVDLPGRPDSRASVAHVADPGTTQDTVILAETVGLTAADPDHFMLQLGNEILGGGFSARLYQDLRVRTGYVYTVSSRYSWARHRGGYSISFGADPDKVDAARKAALHDLDMMRTQPVSDTELAMAKATMLRGQPLRRASLDAISSEYLYLVSLGLPLDTPAIAARAYYGASAAAIQQSFARWMRPDDMATVVKGPGAP
ncbi:insulinase family protein [Ameyamaea chiangmaiensis]|nr:pitrilysin family protein [Ameyamaea chiangmaiensis]MBS4075613.1 insulinase family protein [Ameyamaea chiangmaiensis]